MVRVLGVHILPQRRLIMSLLTCDILTANFEKAIMIMYFAIIIVNYKFFSVFAMFVISQRLIKVVIKNTLQLLIVTTLHQRLRFPKEGYHRTFIKRGKRMLP